MTPIVIDCKGHLLGRLASVVAKELLCGKEIVLVRCEELQVTGSCKRRVALYKHFLNKATPYNHARGAFHYHTPGMMVQRTIRGMLPQKTPRGQAAYGRLTCYEGVPEAYRTVKRMRVPAAMRVLKVRPQTRTTRVGDIASRVGWKFAEVVARSEAERKAKSTH